MALKYKQKYNPLTGDFDMVSDIAGSGGGFVAKLTGQTFTDGDNVFSTGYLGYECSEVTAFVPDGGGGFNVIQEANLVNTNTTTGIVTVNFALLDPIAGSKIHFLMSKV
jgi:hypothetical protein